MNGHDEYQHQHQDQDLFDTLCAIGELPVADEDQAFQRMSEMNFEEHQTQILERTEAAPSPNQSPSVVSSLDEHRNRRPPWLLLGGVLSAAAVVALLVIVGARLGTRTTDVEIPAVTAPTTAPVLDPSTTVVPPTVAPTTVVEAPSTTEAPPTSLEVPTTLPPVTAPPTTQPAPPPTVADTSSCTISNLQTGVQAGWKVLAAPHALVCSGDWAIATLWNPYSQWDDSTHLFHRQAGVWKPVSSVMPECKWNLQQLGVPTATASQLITHEDAACAAPH